MIKNLVKQLLANGASADLESIRYELIREGVAELHRQGLHRHVDVAKRLGVTPPTVRNHLKRLGLYERVNTSNSLTGDEVDYILERWGTVTMREIANGLKRPYNTVYNCGIKFGKPLMRDIP